MALIKQSRSKDLLRDAVVLDFADLTRQAERLMNEARSKAEQIIEESRAEAQQLIDQADEVGHKQGYERGYTEGLEKGREQGRQEVVASLKPQLEAIIAAWNKALEQWETDREELLLQAREDVITFAFALGRKITCRMIEQDPTIVGDQLAYALKLLGEPSAMTIHVHPESKAIIEDIIPELLNQYAGCEHATIKEDPAISRGGCRVSAAGGEVDSTIETQSARLAEALLPPDRTQQARDAGETRRKVDEDQQA